MKSRTRLNRSGPSMGRLLLPILSSALAERLTGGRYVDVIINRDAAARFGMNIADVQ